MEDDIYVEDFELSKEPVRYQIWLLGISKELCVTDFEYMIDEFDNYKEALKCAEFFSDINNIPLIKNKDENFKVPDNVCYINLTVETAVDIDGVDTNIDTIYDTTLRMEDYDENK